MVERAVEAARVTAASLGLLVEDAAVLSDSNRLVVRLTPADVVARVGSLADRASAEREVELARQLAETASPLAGLDPRVEPRLHVRDGFTISLWSHYDASPPSELVASDYGSALVALHAGLRRAEVPAPHFSVRIRDTEHWVARPSVAPDLAAADRGHLVDTLADAQRRIDDNQASEQLLHGEPHPYNLLNTSDGPLFVDLENCVTGPIEYDLAWVPRAVSEGYPGADQELVEVCRGAVLAMVAAHRWRRDDRHPSGGMRVAFLDTVRRGPPWATLDEV